MLACERLCILCCVLRAACCLLLSSVTDTAECCRCACTRARTLFLPHRLRPSRLGLLRVPPRVPSHKRALPIHLAAAAHTSPRACAESMGISRDPPASGLSRMSCVNQSLSTHLPFPLLARRFSLLRRCLRIIADAPSVS